MSKMIKNNYTHIPIYDNDKLIGIFSENSLFQYLFKDEIRSAIEETKKNNLQFQDFTYASSGDKQRVIGRIQIMYQIISEIIGKYGDEGEHRIFSPNTKEDLWHDNYICPYSNGGETIMENAQLLHRHCNREKSNKNQEVETVNFEEEEN